jgi:hypothetical protein
MNNIELRKVFRLFFSAIARNYIIFHYLFASLPFSSFTPFTLLRHSLQQPKLLLCFIESLCAILRIGIEFNFYPRQKQNFFFVGLFIRKFHLTSAVSIRIRKGLKTHFSTSNIKRVWWKNQCRQWRKFKPSHCFQFPLGAGRWWRKEFKWQ